MSLLRSIVIVLLAAALFGCGGEGDRETATDDSSGAAPPTLKTVTHPEALSIVTENGAEVTVVNFWATWCVPCVEEFPAFVRLDRELEDRGVEVMFVSTDFPDQKQKVVEFLAEQGIAGTSYLKASGNTTEFVNGFSKEWSGAVPATFVYDSNGTLLEFWEGKVSYQELKQRTTKHLEGG